MINNGAVAFNAGDIIATFIILCIFLLVIRIIFSFFKSSKRNEKRADERLNLEKQQTLHLQKQVDDLNNRLIVIEKMLKEVD